MFVKPRFGLKRAFRLNKRFQRGHKRTPEDSSGQICPYLCPYPFPSFVAVWSRSYTLPMAAVHPWPDIPDEQRWSIELMEELLERTTQPARELAARADELRAQAAQTDIDGYRDAALALADRYEHAAAARLASA